ncbi:Inner membrane ABC transporter permease protein ycjP [Chlamydia abortus]|uniref:carbohydrate ABC transporter permease n=1 Tax=Paenibacillus sp. SAFN-117 TaxID=3436860 RepID=UPI000A27D89D|nr:Inner membrane ABC transporter permease protein ycjP [Chlamydia abortus]
MSRRIKNNLVTTIAYAVVLVWLFPMLYMLLSSFKFESQVAVPSLAFTPTMDNYRAVVTPDFFKHLFNSVQVTFGTVIISAILGVLGSYALVYSSIKKANNLYFWFITTIFLPAVAVITPVYIILAKLNMLDTKLALILLNTGAGIPLMIWMCTTYFKEIPGEIIEAATIDGCSKTGTFFKIMLPLIKNGIISSALLVFIVTWNEFFFAVTATATKSATLPVYMSKFMTQQGYFWGKMSAAGTMVVLIPVLLGFFSYKSFVKGLTAGSVKG